jgi:3-oxoacyl-[acyl-carrier-protein] synthase II
MDHRNSRRRVVVTGLGLVTPLGTGTEKNWEALVAGRSGIRAISRFDPSDLPSRIAGEVPDFEPADWIERRDLKKMDLFIQYAVAAAHMALDAARLRIDESESERTGVIVGTGIGGLTTIEENHRRFLENGQRKVSPFFVPRLIANLGPGQIAIRFGARGINYAPASACASGAHAVGEAYRLIALGAQDAVLAGGAEAPLCALGVAGFVAMRALSERNKAPARASRPFDRGRDGFVIAEGAGILVLEALERARHRGAPVLAEIVGYGANCDAYHITQPAPEGAGAARCIGLALEEGGIDPRSVGYVNAHGSATPYNDAAETAAIKRVFAEHSARLAVSSTKSMTGHALGAAGGIEAAFTVLALSRGVLPPTINYEEPDPACDLDYVPNRARPADVEVALSNSFGFGGTNVCLAFRRAPAAT